VAVPGNFELLGFGPEGIWAADLDAGGDALVLFQAGQHAPVASAFAPGAQGWLDAMTFGSLPYVSGSQALIGRYDPSLGITLDDWGAPPNDSYVVTAGWAVFWQPGGAVVVKKAPAL